MRWIKVTTSGVVELHQRRRLARLGAPSIDCYTQISTPEATTVLGELPKSCRSEARQRSATGK